MKLLTLYIHEVMKTETMKNILKTVTKILALKP